MPVEYPKEKAQTASVWAEQACPVAGADLACGHVTGEREQADDDHDAEQQDGQAQDTFGRPGLPRRAVGRGITRGHGASRRCVRRGMTYSRCESCPDEPARYTLRCYRGRRTRIVVTVPATSAAPSTSRMTVELTPLLIQ